MNKPILTIVAGCSGSGKSSFSSALTPNNTPPFDYDKEYLNIYKKEIDSDVRNIVVHNKTRHLLEGKIEFSNFSSSKFTYEINFNSTPLY